MRLCLFSATLMICPEFFDYISERLFKAGASDVYYSHTIMKKGRPGIVMNVICESGLTDKIKEIIFTESTTLGLRTFRFQKDTLVREFRNLSTKYGEITVKYSFLNGREVSAKPEFETCRKIASETGVPLKGSLQLFNFRNYSEK